MCATRKLLAADLPDGGIQELRPRWPRRPVTHLPTCYGYQYDAKLPSLSFTPPRLLLWSPLLHSRQLTTRERCALQCCNCFHALRHASLDLKTHLRFLECGPSTYITPSSGHFRFVRNTTTHSVANTDCASPSPPPSSSPHLPTEFSLRRSARDGSDARLHANLRHPNPSPTPPTPSIVGGFEANREALQSASHQHLLPCQGTRQRKGSPKQSRHASHVATQPPRTNILDETTNRAAQQKSALS